MLVKLVYFESVLHIRVGAVFEDGVALNEFADAAIVRPLRSPACGENAHHGGRKEVRNQSRQHLESSARG